jgi:hypothetical protein
MTEYSEETKRLAHELAAKVGKKLEGTDRQLTRDAAGRYVIIPRPGRSSATSGSSSLGRTVGRWRAAVAEFRRRGD